jgi:hypothetical protein
MKGIFQGEIMNKFFILGTLSFIVLGSAHAQEYLQCNLKISDNRIDCPFFSKCYHKPLKESKTQLDLELFDGDKKSGKVQLKRVLVNPDSEDEKDNEIIVFKDDQRPEEIMKEPKSKMITYDSAEAIKYVAQKYGDSIDIQFKTSVYTMDINLTGNGSYSTFFPTQDNLISASCEKVTKAIFDERKAKEIAIKQFKANQEKTKGVSKE